MTIYSGKTRVSEEEDLWRVIGIHEVTDPNESDQEYKHGYMDSENGIFYSLLKATPDIYYDLITKKYKYKKSEGEYPNCTITEGYYTTNGFYTTPINGENHKIYLDQDTDKYYIYDNQVYREITKYQYQTPNGTTKDTVYYHNNVFYKYKDVISPNIIAILVGDEYEQHPYVQGILSYNTFYSDQATFDPNCIYYNNNTETYYNYDTEEEALVESSYEFITNPNENDQVTCYINIQSGESEIKTLVTGYIIGDNFYKTVSAGYKDAIVPNGVDDTKNVYYDQLNNAYYFLFEDGFRQMPIYEQLEEHNTHDQSANIVGKILYYHNYENEEVLHSRNIIDGFYVGGNFYTTRLNGDPTAIYHVTGTNNFWKYNDIDNAFYPYALTTPYEIGVLYSGKINPSINSFYEDSTGDIYYYDGSYHLTSISNAYYVPTKNIMCQNKISNFTENNKNLYYNLLNKNYYIYKNDDRTLVKTNPVDCYIIDNIPYKKERAAMGAIYFDEETEQYYVYNNGVFEPYDNNIPISNENQIVLSLTKQDMLIDDNILDQDPYDQDVILSGATSQRAGLLTADMYDKLISLHNRYKMRISSDTYDTLSDLENAAPQDDNCIYIVGAKEQYVLSDDGSYVKIGDTDSLDFSNIASVDDLSDILEQINLQKRNLQNEISALENELDLKYPTANIITDINKLTNSLYENEAVSSKVLLEYINDLMSGAVTVDQLVTERVVEKVEKYEDSIRVYYKDIVTAMPYAYIDDTLDSTLADSNHTFSARLLQSAIDDLQDQIDNIVDSGLSFGWASNNKSDGRIMLSINNRMV